MWCKAILLSCQPRVSRKEWTARSQEATILRETSGRRQTVEPTELDLKFGCQAMVWLHHALVKNDSYPAFKNVYQTLLFQITYKRLCIGKGNADSRTLTSDLITQWVITKQLEANQGAPMPRQRCRDSVRKHFLTLHSKLGQSQFLSQHAKSRSLWRKT